MDQDEEMDTSLLTQPFFTTDKEKGARNNDTESQADEDRDSGQEEDPGPPEEEEEQEEDADVSIIRRVSARMQTRTNGRQHSCQRGEFRR